MRNEKTTTNDQKFTFPQDQIAVIADMTDYNEHTHAVAYLAEKLRENTKDHWSAPISAFPNEYVKDAKAALDAYECDGYASETVQVMREGAMLMCKVHLNRFFTNADEVLAAF